jgi:signal transduction histidine kinase
VREAVAELRALARGVYPPLLRTGGLAAALHGLAETRPLRCGELPAQRLPDAVESTVYLLAERLSATGWTTLRAEVLDGQVRVGAHVAGEPPELGDIAARVATLDGTVRTAADREGTLVEVQLPVGTPAARKLT